MVIPRQLPPVPAYQLAVPLNINREPQLWSPTHLFFVPRITENMKALVTGN